MTDYIASIDKSHDIEALWALALRGLEALGITHVIYLTVDANRENPFAMTNCPDVYQHTPPQDDPFLAHCCKSYEITRAGQAFLSEHDYLRSTERDFIQNAANAGFTAGLGIPVRVQGSSRFGGFLLGTGLDRATFKTDLLPHTEYMRFFCLIAHRRIEELTRTTPITSMNRFRDLLVAPGFDTVADLSPRERELIYLVARGLSRKECARMCDISINTVSDYLKSAYRKLGVSNRAEAAQRLWQGRG